MRRRRCSETADKRIIIVSLPIWNVSSLVFVENIKVNFIISPHIFCTQHRTESESNGRAFTLVRYRLRHRVVPWLIKQVKYKKGKAIPVTGHGDP
jgi:hypothetical protein